MEQNANGATTLDYNKKYTATWLSPVEGGRVTSLYGNRINPVLDVEEMHNGIDIAIEKGNKAVAVADGIITETGKSETYGKYIKYSVSNEYSVMYAHLHKIKASKGDNVKKGETIALTGDSGLVTGPHLHYSIFYNGTSIDPLSLY